MKKTKNLSMPNGCRKILRGVGILLLGSLCVVPFARAEILIPVEELPNETVIPQLDAPLAVYDRTVTYAGKFSASVGSDLILDEPFYQGQSLQVKAGYNWSEVSGLYLNYQSWFGGVSRYASDFSGLDFTKASGPSHGLGLEYQHRFLYGKICLSRDIILPITMSWSVEAGEIAYGSRNLPYGGVGFTNIFYFSPSWGFDLDLHLVYRTIIDPLSQDIAVGHTPAATEGEFSTTNRLNSSLAVSAVYIF